MSCIVYQVDKKTGVKYAYESESYWDKDKQQPRSRRTYLGKVDPETGEIIPKEKRGPHSDSKKEKPSAELDRLFEEIEEIKAKDTTISELREELKAERKKSAKLEEALRRISAITEDAAADV